MVSIASPMSRPGGRNERRPRINHELKITQGKMKESQENLGFLTYVGGEVIRLNLRGSCDGTENPKCSGYHVERGGRWGGGARERKQSRKMRE